MDFSDISDCLKNIEIETDFKNEPIIEDHITFIMKKNDWIVFTNDALGFRIFHSISELFTYFNKI